MSKIITNGIKKLSKPEDVSVCLPPGFKRCRLSVVRDGDTELLPISKKVAEALISSGVAYQG